jgi:hypothetical protein
MTRPIRNLLLMALLALALPTGALAQSSEDTSGADQYTEQGIPGSEAPAEPTEPEPAPEPAPTPTPSAPSGSTAPSTAEPIATTAQTETTLPRTGAEEAWIALTALLLLGCGLGLRRVVPQQSA